MPILATKSTLCHCMKKPLVMESELIPYFELATLRLLTTGPQRVLLQACIPRDTTSLGLFLQSNSLLTLRCHEVGNIVVFVLNTKTLNVSKWQRVPLCIQALRTVSNTWSDTGFSRSMVNVICSDHGKTVMLSSVLQQKSRTIHPAACATV